MVLQWAAQRQVTVRGEKYADYKPRNGPNSTLVETRYQVERSEIQDRLRDAAAEVLPEHPHALNLTRRKLCR